MNRGRRAKSRKPVAVAAIEPAQRAAQGGAKFGAGLDAEYRAQEGKGTGRSCSSWAAKRPAAKQPVLAKKKPDATIRARAAAERSTRNAAERETRSPPSGCCCWPRRRLDSRRDFSRPARRLTKRPRRRRSPLRTRRSTTSTGSGHARQAEYTVPAERSILWRRPGASGIPPARWRCFEAPAARQARRRRIAKLSVRTSDGVIFAYGNYVLPADRLAPGRADLKQLYNQLPIAGAIAPAALLTALPPDGLIPNSERYILGPVSLDRFEPQHRHRPLRLSIWVPKRQLGQYKTAKG